MAKGGEFVLPGELLEIFTVEDLTEEQELIRQTARKFVAENITTDDAIKRIESKDLGFQRDLLRKLAELGFLGIEVPEEYGGVNLGVVVAAIVAEEIARQGSFAVTMGAHKGIATLPTLYFGNEEQKKKYLPKLVSADWVGAYTLTEPGAGSDAKGVTTTAIKSQDGRYYVLNGKKSFGTNGGLADVFTVFANLEGAELTAFMVEKTFPGIEIGQEEHKMGIQGSSTTPVFLDNCMVPVENLLGEPGKGFKIAVNILNLGRFYLGAACLGAGRMCLEESLEYSKQRKQFDQSICNFGAIREKLARMAAKNYIMESIVYRTAGLLNDAIHGVDANDPRAILKAIEEFAIECSLVKVECSEALDYIVDENVQIHGGSGFCEGAPERHYRDSRINRLFEGTNEINRLLMPGMLLKRPAILMRMAVEGKKIINEAMSPTSLVVSEELTEILTTWLDGAKKSFLVVCDAMNEKFKPMLDGGAELLKHQIVLMGIADFMIEIYKMESVLKALSKHRDVHKENLTRLIFQESLLKIDNLIRRLMPMCSEGDNMSTRLAMTRRFMKFKVENEDELCNKIAEALLQRG